MSLSSVIWAQQEDLLNQTVTDQLAEQFDQLQALATKLQAPQLDIYAQMRLRVIERGLAYRLEDIKYENDALAGYATDALMQLMTEEKARLQAILDGHAKPVDSPRLDVTQPPVRNGSHLQGQVRWVDGRVEKRPVMLFGFGHFHEMRRDIDWLASLGCNFVQTEIGPRYLRPAADRWDSGVSLHYRDFIKHAYKQGVLVDMLLSPHYFPQWALDANPDWFVHLGGFLRIAINQPGVNELLRSTQNRMFEEWGELPGLWSVCLSNEPVAFKWADDPDTQSLWIAYLKQTYGEVQAMNQAWGTDYQDWSQVKCYLEPPTLPFPAEPELYDWMQFNNQRFTHWHAMLNNNVHSAAKSSLTHIKMMTRHYKQYDLMQAVDLDQMTQLTDLAGKDGGLYPRYLPLPVDEQISHPQKLFLTNKLMSQASDKPMLNTENHLLRDRGTNPILPNAVRSSFWLQALSGLDASTAWCWGRRDNNKHQLFLGLFSYRPGAMEQYMRTGLDLMRLMPVVQAMADQAPRIALVHSPTSLLRNADVMDLEFEVCNQLLQTGVAFTAISEQEFAAGNIPDSVELVILPQTSHAPDAFVQRLETWAKNGFHHNKAVLGLGKGILQYDPYCKRRRSSKLDFMQDTAVIYQNVYRVDLEKLSGTLHATLEQQRIKPQYQFVDKQTQKPVPGIVSSVADVDGQRWISAVNIWGMPRELICIETATGRKCDVSDQLSLIPQKAGPVIELQPLDVICGRIQ
ncbi:MAG: beta-galactosidase [Phycisphaeraceae bacterium JB051]